MNTSFINTLTFVVSLITLPTSNYKISATFDGLPDQSNAYLVTQNNDTLQSTKSQGNTIYFTGNLISNGQFLFIKFDSIVTPISSNAIYITNETIIVNGKIGTPTIEVKGSPGHDLYLKSRDFAKAWSEKLKPYSDKLKANDTIISAASIKNDTTTFQKGIIERKYIELEIDSVRNIYMEEIGKWCLKYNNSTYTPYVVINSILRPRVSEDKKKAILLAKSIYTQLDSISKYSYYGKELKNTISDLEITESSPLNTSELKLPNIELKDSTGNLSKLIDIIKMNRITLIDCWASWCSPCRAAFPNLLNAYNKYNAQGFNIVSISSDKNEIKWKKALNEEKMPWPNLIEDSRSLITIFQLRGIPAYILVNSEGRIIAFDGISRLGNFGGSLNGENLESTLAIYFNQQTSKD